MLYRSYRHLVDLIEAGACEELTASRDSPSGLQRLQARKPVDRALSSVSWN